MALIEVDVQLSTGLPFEGRHESSTKPYLRIWQTRENMPALTCHL